MLSWLFQKNTSTTTVLTMLSAALLVGAIGYTFTRPISNVIISSRPRNIECSAEVEKTSSDEEDKEEEEIIFPVN